MLCEHVTKIKWNKYSKKKKRIYIFIDKYTIIHLSVLFAYYIGNISDRYIIQENKLHLVNGL